MPSPFFIHKRTCWVTVLASMSMTLSSFMFLLI